MITDDAPRIRVLIPIFNRSAAFADIKDRAESAAHKWREMGAEVEVREIWISGVKDMWYNFDIAKLEFLRRMSSEADARYVCVVTDADVVPEFGLNGLVGLHGKDRVGFGSCSNGGKENCLIACTAQSDAVNRAIGSTLDIMKRLECRCDYPHKHSFRATVNLLPTCVNWCKNNSGLVGHDVLGAPSCPDNSHYAVYLDEFSGPIPWEDRPDVRIRVWFPTSTH
eukprot:jgi/Tetstr1/448460/TSEL_035728.t1